MACYRETWCQTLVAALILATVRASGDQPELPIPYSAAGYETHEVPHESHESHVPSGTYLQHYGPAPEGYKVQSGFEGYIVPAIASAYGFHPVKEGSLGVVSSLLAHVQPVIYHLSEVLPKVAIFVVSVIALLFVGTLLTSCLCAFTPFCHMTFLGVNLTRENVRGLITHDRVAEIATFLQNSIKKYQEMNAKVATEPSSVETNEVK